MTAVNPGVPSRADMATQVFSSEITGNTKGGEN